MSDRIRRKDLKAPDEFVSTTQRAVEYARENPARVAWIAGGALLAVVLALGVRAYREWSADQAREAFSAAHQRLSQGSPEEAARSFEAIHAEHPGTPQAEVALAQAGGLWAEAGKDDEARAAFQKLLDATSNPDLRQIALYNLGTLERSRDPESAGERLRRAAETPGPLRGAAWLAAAGLTGGPVPGGDMPEGIPAGAREYLEARREG